MMRRQRRHRTGLQPLGALLLLSIVACSDGEANGGPAAGGATGGSSAAGAGGTGGSADAGAAGAGANATGGGGTGGSSGSGPGAAGAAGTAGAAGSGAVARVGVCGVRSAGVVTADSFETYEEHYLLGDEGFGDALCVVRFDVRRAGDAPDGCDESAGQQDMCLWTHLVEYSNPSVLVDEDGACEDSELAMDSAAIAAIDGQQVAYGYVFEYQGHNSVLMRYDEARGWQPGVNAGWSPETGDFQFDRRDGFCAY
ncbi:MAG TPA: hypothetical protein VKZ49_16280 [Polyangiaceae bacterium]|nr:hypothetical protein [Polyangiaceae bacterium]